MLENGTENLSRRSFDLRYTHIPSIARRNTPTTDPMTAPAIAPPERPLESSVGAARLAESDVGFKVSSVVFDVREGV